MWPWIRKSGPSGNRVGRIDCCILLARSSSFCSTTSLSRDASASRHSATRRSVRSMVTRRSAKSSGLVTKSKAPRFMAVRMFSMSPYAETMTQRRLGSTLAICASRVSPSIFGMLMSDSTMSMSSCCSSSSRASTPSLANTNSYLPARTSRRMRCRISGSTSGSSSTTRILWGCFTTLIAVRTRPTPCSRCTRRSLPRRRHPGTRCDTCRAPVMPSYLPVPPSNSQTPCPPPPAPIVPCSLTPRVYMTSPAVSVSTHGASSEMPSSEPLENTRHSVWVLAPSTNGPPLLSMIVWVPVSMPPVNVCQP